MRDQFRTGLGGRFVFLGGDALSGHFLTRPLQNRAWNRTFRCKTNGFAAPEICFYD
jgi:hypothetical protein